MWFQFALIFVVNVVSALPEQRKKYSSSCHVDSFCYINRELCRQIPRCELPP